MQLFVPTIGSRMRLTEDWTFSVFLEHRNKTLEQFESCPKNTDPHNSWWDYKCPKIGEITFPKDTILKLDRIFIRKNMDGFDSMSFFVEETSLKKKVSKSKRVRFWAKLEDCNTIKFEFEM